MGSLPDEPLVYRLAGWAHTRPDLPAYTFVDYLDDPAGVPRGYTWGRLHREASGLAERLCRVADPGDRVAILAPSGPEYVLALFAAWYAGMIAVPLFAPDRPEHADRLAAGYADCAPRCVVTVPRAAAGVREFLAAGEHRPTLLVLGPEPAPAQIDPDWRPASVAWDDVAYLQYTSGSTRSPAGVEITHRNLTENVRQVCATLLGGRTRFTAVSWLPLFHDMGLLATVGTPLWGGADAVFFDPAAFLMQPVRWLRQLSGRPAACTAAPNFAYDYCARRLRPDDLDGVDLRGVVLWLNGAEPVLAGTMERFFGLLAGTGLDAGAMCPAYGLAEATVFVTADRTGRPPRATRFDAERLAGGEAVPAPEGAPGSTLASCGRPPAGQRVTIVDPERCTAAPAGRVGEIWVHGPNVADRYWGKPELSARVFDAVLAGPVPAGLPAGPWLRTGDLGVLHDGDLYVTGRLKDLIVLAGRNHYPQDVEETVSLANPSVGRAAAFSVTVEDRERVVVVCEVPGPRDRLAAEAARQTRAAVWQRHDLVLHEVVFVAPGGIPRTTSGKMSRTRCRDQYLAGDYRLVAGGRAHV